MTQQINHLHLEQEIWLRQMINQEDHINANIDTQLKTSMIRSHLCKYSDAYIHVKAAITILNTAADATPVNDTNKKVISKN